MPAEAIRLRRLSAEVHSLRRQPMAIQLPDRQASNECLFCTDKCTWFCAELLVMTSSSCHFLTCCHVCSTSDRLFNRFAACLNENTCTDRLRLSEMTHRRTASCLCQQWSTLHLTANDRSGHQVLMCSRRTQCIFCCDKGGSLLNVAHSVSVLSLIHI